MSGFRRLITDAMPSSSTQDLPFPKPQEKYDFPNPVTQSNKDAFRTKPSSKYYDPCGPASEASMKCLDRNNYDKSKCEKAFEAYRECKRIWMNKRREDRRNNVPKEYRFW